jgi:hypothetical protein
LKATESPVSGSRKQQAIQVLDIGVGASCIYPILGVKEYGWKFVGSDVNEQSLKVADAIAKFNPGLYKNITLRKQPNPDNIFREIIQEGECFHLTLCNPPSTKMLRLPTLLPTVNGQSLAETQAPPSILVDKPVNLDQRWRNCLSTPDDSRIRKLCNSGRVVHYPSFSGWLPENCSSRI